MTNNTTKTKLAHKNLLGRLATKLNTLLYLRARLLILLVALVAALIGGIGYELKTSALQSYAFHKMVKKSTYSMQQGLSSQTWYPTHGPYDKRLGYTKIPEIIDYLTRTDFSIAQQASLSPEMLTLIENGIYPPYKEKIKTGITILDRNNTTIYSAYRPERIYEHFDTIPSVVLKTLLFIENKELLSEHYPYKNPAIEWDRFLKAIAEKTKQIFDPSINAPGGSTIATQLQKYRHSIEGRTHGVQNKLLQIASASFRSYLYGRDTSHSRKMFILDYINSIPLAALKGYGEAHGLGDGLWVWYRTNFERASRSLRSIQPSTRSISGQQARYFKEILSLFLAHRRPSFYLLQGVNELNGLTNAYLSLLAKAHIIPPHLAKKARDIPLRVRSSAPKQAHYSFVQRKAANAIRTRLLPLLKMRSLYDLDQVDITVKSTIDNQATERVTRILKELGDSKVVKQLGLHGHRNLAKGDPSKVIYSLTVFEKQGTANLLRVQTDNFNNPFNINEGARLDLGSTAKLRTVATYLDIISTLHETYTKKTLSELRALSEDKSLDPISRFVAYIFIRNKTVPLDALLEAALDRKYSANPNETFFTGGGIHRFENFDDKDNARRATVREALIRSINLPLVRLMRDISQYYTHRFKNSLSTKSVDGKDAMRAHFLSKFADNEGQTFLRKFFEKYRFHPKKGRLYHFAKSTRATPRRTAAIFRYVRPTGTQQQLEKFIARINPNMTIPSALLEKWHTEFTPGAYSLNDHAFIARVHPLELWLVREMFNSPNASLENLISKSTDIRQHVYTWLFKTPQTEAQDIRIRTLIEHESFIHILAQWKKMGYPFDYMVPSLASALGSSGDRPIALADLVGIIMNDGKRYPLVRLEEIHLAAETPFDVSLTRNDRNPGTQVLHPEVARALRYLMHDVVRFGTGRRVFNAFKRSDGTHLLVGGKTGTGDHRFETYGPGGKVLTSRVVNRTATFVFWIGDRFFGVLSAHVPGEEAENYDFTSSLTTQLLKSLAPALMPMLEQSGVQPAPFASPAKKQPKRLFVGASPFGQGEAANNSTAAVASQIVVLPPSS